MKGLPTLNKSHFKTNIMFATNDLNCGGKNMTLDKIFGSNFKRIKVPEQVPKGFKH